MRALRSFLKSAGRLCGWTLRLRAVIALLPLRWQVLVFLVGLGALAGALWLRPAWQSHRVRACQRLLAEAQAAIGKGDYELAARLGRQAAYRAARQRELLGPSLAVLGLAEAKAAEGSQPDRRSQQSAQAARHLHQALRVGLSPSQELTVRFHLGKCWLRAGKRSAGAACLQRVAEAGRQRRAEALELLSEEALGRSPPAAQLAWQYNARLLRQSGLSAAQLRRAWRRRARILALLGRTDWLAGLSPADFEGDRVLCQTLLAVDDQWQARSYQAAVSSLRNCLSARQLPPAIERRARYLLGLALAAEGKDNEAVAELQRLVWSSPGTGEARGASAQLGTILVRLGRASEGVQAFAEAVSQKLAPPDRDLELWGDQALACRIAESVDRLQSSEQFELAARLLDSYGQVAAAPVADRRAAQLDEQWAAALERQASSLASSEAAQSRYRAQELYRRAAARYLALASSARPTRRAIGDLWRAAQRYADGAEPLAAYETLQKLLALKPAASIRARAYGLACVVLEQSDRLQELQRVAAACLHQFPHQAAAAIARYRLARCQMRHGQLEQAEQNLRANLAEQSDRACPKPVRQQSRLALAGLLRDGRRLQEAVLLLRRLLAAPADRQTMIQARWLLADCLRRQANQPAARLSQVQAEQARAHYRRLKEARLQEALDELDRLEKQLAGLVKAHRASTTQTTMLVECRWAMAECLYEMDRYGEAIARCQQLAQTSGEPGDWLRSHILIANCYARMGRIDEARSVLKLAQQRMEQMPADAVEQARIGMSPKSWQEWMDWVTRLR